LGEADPENDEDGAAYDALGLHAPDRASVSPSIEVGHATAFDPVVRVGRMEDGVFVELAHERRRRDAG
jgi:hypothetical protein